MIDETETNWPVRLYLGALVFAFVSMLIFTTALDTIQPARGGAQLAICGVLCFRLVCAVRWRERSKVWIPYVVGMFLAVPIWLAAEHFVFTVFGR